LATERSSLRFPEFVLSSASYRQTPRQRLFAGYKVSLSSLIKGDKYSKTLKKDVT
jgi:hypothetical protein